ncbi:MAG TPA: hypothetical protein DDW49_02895 [Deltaproteobacteria bacterium]|nr:MAG: hypothetical protein A2048_10130 [Deltaproteobacteria bacterium GWA2_45_12]HBF12327.1 hypothetical protein [Deltaproteobacteria bacterium]
MADAASASVLKRVGGVSLRAKGTGAKEPSSYPSFVCDFGVDEGAFLGCTRGAPLTPSLKGPPGMGRRGIVLGVKERSLLIYGLFRSFLRKVVEFYGVVYGVETNVGGKF